MTGGEVATVGGVEAAVAALFWRVEVARAKLERDSTLDYLAFAQQQYADVLGRVVAPGPSSGEPQAKRIKIEDVVEGGKDLKGKGRTEVADEYVIDVDEAAGAKAPAEGDNAE